MAVVVTFFMKLRFQKKEKKVMAALLPLPASLHCVATQLHNRVAFFCCAVAQLHNREKKATIVAVAFFRSTTLQCNKINAAAQRCLFRYVALQRSSTRANIACAAVVAFFVELRCTVELHIRQKKATVAIVAFFVELRCNTAPQQQEGDGSNVAIAFFFFFFSCNTKKKKKAMATLSV